MLANEKKMYGLNNARNYCKVSRERELNLKKKQAKQKERSGLGGATILENDLDFHVKNVIFTKLAKTEKFRNFEEVQNTEDTETKEDMFDKKEFSYCRKMLWLKRVYGIGPELGVTRPSDFLSAFETDKIVQDETKMMENHLRAEQVIEEREKSLMEQKKKLIMQSDRDEDALRRKSAHTLPFQKREHFFTTLKLQEQQRVEQERAALENYLPQLSPRELAMTRSQKQHSASH